MSNRLSAFSAHLPPDLLELLLDLNIRTVADFILTPPLDLLARLPRGSTSLGELKDCIACIAQAVAAEGTDGEALYAAEMQRVSALDGEDVRSGIADLDALVGGSFGGAVGGRVIEVSGDKGGGKTALALHVVLNHLVQHERAAAVWIDTTGDLSPGRITQVYPAHAGPAAQTVLQRLHISPAFDIDAAYNVLDSLRAALTTTTDGQPHPRIVVIDSITPLLGPHLTAVTAQGHATMVTFMRSLRELARSHSLSILVTNTSTNANGHNPSSVFAHTTRKPALGPSFTFLTDATLWVAYPPPPNPDFDPFMEEPSEQSTRFDNSKELRVIEVFRSNVSAGNRWCIVRVRNGVVMPL